MHEIRDLCVGKVNLNSYLNLYKNRRERKIRTGWYIISVNCGKNLRALAFGRVAPTRCIIDVTAHTCVLCVRVWKYAMSHACVVLCILLSLAWLDKTAKASASVLAHSKIVLEFLSLSALFDIIDIPR